MSTLLHAARAHLRITFTLYTCGTALSCRYMFNSIINPPWLLSCKSPILVLELIDANSNAFMWAVSLKSDYQRKTVRASSLGAASTWMCGLFDGWVCCSLWSLRVCVFVRKEEAQLPTVHSSALCLPDKSTDSCYEGSLQWSCSLIFSMAWRPLVENNLACAFISLLYCLWRMLASVFPHVTLCLTYCHLPCALMLTSG